MSSQKKDNDYINHIAAMPPKKPTKKGVTEPKAPKKSRAKKRASSASVKKSLSSKGAAKKSGIKKVKTSRRNVTKKEHKDMRAAVEAIPSLIFEEVLFDAPVSGVSKDMDKKSPDKSLMFKSRSAGEVKKKQHILIIGVTLFSVLIVLVWGVSLKAKIGNISFQGGLVGGEVETSLTDGYAALSETLSVIKEQKSAASETVDSFVAEAESAEKEVLQDGAFFEQEVVSSIAEKIRNNATITTHSTTQVEGLESLQ